MRKIITKKDKEKRDKRNILIIGIILMSILLFGTIGFAFGNSDNKEVYEKIEYNNINFIKNNYGWNFIINENEFITQYNPLETKDIIVPIFFGIEQYKEQPLYLIGNYQLANSEIAKNIERFTLRVRAGCLDENCSIDAPIKNCFEDNIISIREPNKEKERIYNEGKCIFIVAENQNQTKYVDAFLFKLLDIN